MATEDVKRRTRSPIYPALDLEEAMRYAETIYKKEDRHPFPPDAAAAHWEFKTTSSAVGQVISALKQFGLLIEEPGAARRLRLSPMALDLMVHLGSGKQPDARAIQMVKTAALNPKLHREIWEKYGGALPSNESLKFYLLRERDVPFNKDQVDRFINNFRSSIGYAKVESGDILAPAEENDGSDSEQVRMQKTIPERVSPASGAPSDTSTSRIGHEFTPSMPAASSFLPAFSCPVSPTNTAEIRFQRPFSHEEFENFKMYVELLGKSMATMGNKQVEQEANNSAANADRPNPDGGRGSGGSQGR